MFLRYVHPRHGDTAPTQAELLTSDEDVGLAGAFMRRAASAEAELAATKARLLRLEMAPRKDPNPTNSRDGGVSVNAAVTPGRGRSSTVGGMGGSGTPRTPRLIQAETERAMQSVMEMARKQLEEER